ncbi:MAG: aminopeptidase [Bacteroidia bacterium]|nr:aminopeptidase [Bacteroidia bacterium]
MKKNLVKVFKISAIVIVIAILWNYKLIGYGISQLRGQLNIVFNTVDVADVLKDPKTAPETLEKLNLINEIRSFAIDSLGLANADNYTTYYDQQGKPLMWVVTGCEPYKLKAKKWKFPVVGEVSYKGFFNEPAALEEASKIRNEGYETDIYSPSAWSTLGYFTDPVLSGMLKRSPGRLAELIIHELTHATLYLESSVDFNENFATFTGEKGAELFLIFKYGEGSSELQNYREFLHDEALYTRHMIASSRKLDSLYNALPSTLTNPEKALLKYRMIASILLEQNKLPFRSQKRYRFNFQTKTLPNNTEFMAFLRYREKQDLFSEVYRTTYRSDFKFFITDIASKASRKEKLPFKIAE